MRGIIGGLLLGGDGFVYFMVALGRGLDFV